MNIGEARAVNVLLSWLLASHDDPQGPDWDRACNAAAQLADRAHKAVATAGWTGDWTGEQVRDAWQHLELPGMPDDEWPVDEWPLLHTLVAELLEMQDQGAIDLDRWPTAKAVVDTVKRDMPRAVRDVQTVGGVL